MSALVSGLSAFAASFGAAAVDRYYKRLQAQQPRDPTHLRAPFIDRIVAWLSALAMALITLASIYAGGLSIIVCFFTFPLLILFVWWARRAAAVQLQQIEGGFRYWTSKSKSKHRTVLWENVKKVGSDGPFCFDLKDGQRVKVTESLVGLRVLAQLVADNIPDEKLMSSARRRCHELLALAD